MLKVFCGLSVIRQRAVGVRIYKFVSHLLQSPDVIILSLLVGRLFQNGQNRLCDVSSTTFAAPDVEQAVSEPLVRHTLPKTWCRVLVESSEEILCSSDIKEFAVTIID